MGDIYDGASPETSGGGVGRPTDEARGIRFDISLKAHEYVKTFTQNLTKLRTESSDDLKRISSRRESDKEMAGLKTGDLGSGAIPVYLKTYSERLHDPGTDSPLTPAYSKDYARIVHSPSFRRLQGKTQLIPAGENDFFRTRLTHSLEVGEIARRIALRLKEKYKDQVHPHFIDPDIVVCASLLHDIGHPPFGHSGEEELNRRMDGYGGFEGNAQVLRIVTKLENRLGRGSVVEERNEDPHGLNLTIGTLSSVLKYDAVSDGPICNEGKIEVAKGYYSTEASIVHKMREQLGLRDPERRLYTIECQIMDLADDIAYSTYDLEDTLEAGIVAPFDLMSIDDAALTEITNDVNRQLINKRLPDLKVTPAVIIYRLAHVFGTLILEGENAPPYDFKEPLDRMVFVGRTYLESQQHAKNPLIRRQYLETLIEENIEALSIEYDHDFPYLSRLCISRDRLITIEAMKSFNFHKVISSRRLQMHHHRATKIVGAIFEALKNDPKGKLLSEHQRHLLAACGGDESKRMRLVADIVSGFTDMEAMRFYDQLHSSRNQPFLGYSR
jgi:dGTPase